LDGLRKVIEVINNDKNKIVLFYLNRWMYKKSIGIKVIRKVIEVINNDKNKITYFI
jgi:hypothetical protein